MRTKQTARKSTGGRYPRKNPSELDTLNDEYAVVLEYLKTMCNTYETFEELIEDEDDPKQLLETFKRIKEYVFQDLQTAFNEMKTMITTPKIFLIQHFDWVRDQIKDECQKYINNNELKVESKEKAILIQDEMIDEVDSFQKKCLANTKTEQNHQIDLEEFEERLQLQDKDDVMELGADLCHAIHDIKKELFMNQGIVFYTLDNYEILFGILEDHNRQLYSNQIDSLTFGSLILIEDEFLINSDKFESWSEYMINGFVEEQIEVDYCNEYLTIHLLERSILKHLKISFLKQLNFGKPVVRIELNRTKLNDLDCEFFHCDKKLVRQWSFDLPGLIKGQNKPVAKQNYKILQKDIEIQKRDRDCQENVGEKFGMHDDESFPKRFKN